MRCYEIAVVGGGPAGLATAVALGQAGAAPVVLDPRTPWEKPCGGGLSPVALDLFPHLADLTRTSRLVDRVCLTSAHGMQIRLSGERPYFVLSRQELAEGLLALALQSGATHLAERVHRIERVAEGWRLEADRGPITAKFLVGADGVASLVRRTVLAPFGPRDLGVAIGYLLTGLPLDEIRVWFQKPEGFAYLFPRAGEASLGIGWRADEPGGRARSRVALEAARRQWAPGAQTRSMYSFPFPSLVSKGAWEERRCGNGWALVGDAAGHVDPVRGEGIVYAMWGGCLLAEALAAGHPLDYEERWRDCFAQHLRRKVAKRWILSTPGLADIGVLLAAPFPGARRYLYARSQHHD